MKITPLILSNNAALQPSFYHLDMKKIAKKKTTFKFSPAYVLKKFCSMWSCLTSSLHLFPVVTDASMDLSSCFQFHGRPDPHVKETVVPTTYKSKTGALNKSRALQVNLDTFESQPQTFFVFYQMPTKPDLRDL